MKTPLVHPGSADRRQATNAAAIPATGVNRTPASEADVCNWNSELARHFGAFARGSAPGGQHLYRTHEGNQPHELTVILPHFTSKQVNSDQSSRGFGCILVRCVERRR